MGRLIVDTGVLVAIERGRRIDATILPDDGDIAIAAITASECWLASNRRTSGAERLGQPRSTRRHAC